MKNLVYCMSMYRIFKTLEEKKSDEEIELLVNGLESDNIIIDYDHEVIIFKDEKSLNLINDKLGYKFEYQTFSDFTAHFRDGEDYGIKEYNVFHFHYDEIHDGLGDYFYNEECTEELFGLIKKNGIDDTLGDLYMKQVKFMLECRLDYIKSMIENSEIEIW